MQSFLNAGVGSQFFNLQAPDNNIRIILWENIEFKNIYARVKIFGEKTMPLMFDSELNEKKFYTIGDVVLKNIKITDTTYEGGFGFFRLLASTVTIINMTARDIGQRKSFLSSYNTAANLTFFVENPP